MLKNPKLGQAQKGLIAALLCLAFGIAIFDGQLSRQSSPAAKNASTPERADKQNNSRQKESEWMTSDNWLALFTLGLVIVGGIQVRLFWVQLRLIGKSLVDAQKAADASAEAAKAATKQAKIAEATLTQLERPYIFIFGVKGIKQDPESQEFFVEYTVANYGKMPAIIEAPYIGFVISEKGEPPLPPLMFDGHNLMASPIMRSGEERVEIREYFPQGMTGEDINVRIFRVGEPILGSTSGERTETTEVVPTFNIPEGFDIFFRAMIRYRGPFSGDHETGVLWLYNPGSFEFAVRGGDEYNYVR
jgi:hypothetical protein